jgi:transposase
MSHRSSDKPLNKTMTQFKLSRKEHAELEWLISHPPDARLLCRAQAVRWFVAGVSVEEIAQRLFVSRQSVYNWLERFQERAPLALSVRLADGARSGRPRTAHGIIDPLIAEVVETDPRELGYRATIWTAPLLQAYLSEKHQIVVSSKSVAFAITRLQLRWKRPRHRLALRPDTWRQAKGGSNAGLSGASGQCS